MQNSLKLTAWEHLMTSSILNTSMMFLVSVALEDRFAINIHHEVQDWLTININC